MKILLINPPPVRIIKTCLPSYVEQEAGLYPPLGIALVAASVERLPGTQVAIIDAVAEKLDHFALQERIRLHAPDIVGITTTTFSLPDALEAASVVKKVCPQARTVLGGPHLSIYGPETLQQPAVDAVIIGEGEQAFFNFVQAIAGAQSFEGIQGVGFIKNGTPVLNPAADPIANLDTLPFAARHLLPLERYYSIHGSHERMTTMFASRGCPYNCKFCYHAFGRTFRFRSPQNIVDEMEVIRGLGIGEIFFFDDLFTAKKDFVLRTCEEIIRRRIDMVWEIRARVNTVDEEILKKLRQAGCARISYGIESGSDRILAAMRKGITTAQAEHVVRLTKAHGFTVYADFMIGFPDETRQEILNTIAFARRINPDFVQFSITTPYPETELYTMGLERGVFKDDYWREFAKHPDAAFEPRLWNESLSTEELMDLLNVAYRSFYMRPSFILKRLVNIRSMKNFLQYARAGLRVLAGR